MVRIYCRYTIARVPTKKTNCISVVAGITYTIYTDYNIFRTTFYFFFKPVWLREVIKGIRTTIYDLLYYIIYIITRSRLFTSTPRFAHQLKIDLKQFFAILQFVIVAWVHNISYNI